MNIEQKVKYILTDLCGESEISNDDTLRDDLALDSISMVTMLLEFEDAFKIELDEADMNPFDLETVQNIIDMLKKYVGDENEQSS